MQTCLDYYTIKDILNVRHQSVDHELYCHHLCNVYTLQVNAIASVVFKLSQTLYTLYFTTLQSLGTAMFKIHCSGTYQSSSVLNMYESPNFPQHCMNAGLCTQSR